MLLDPIAGGHAFFCRSIVDRLRCQTTKAKEVKAGLHLGGEFNPAYRYAFGADTGKRNGGDHSTSCLIDFSTIRARKVAHRPLSACISVYTVDHLVGLRCGACA